MDRMPAQRAMSASSLYRPLVIESRPLAILETRIDHVPGVIDHYTKSMDRRHPRPWTSAPPGSALSSARSSQVDPFEKPPSRSVLGATWHSMSSVSFGLPIPEAKVVQYGTVKPAFSSPGSAPLFTGKTTLTRHTRR
eukprot:gb/GFBE01060329.1/.p1 GENE.gb/GFBE01060329.1/~~gb/GFBE01060329.1/.p1  ORF type:complete len:137 (+),score=8.49 gb/GFBE01060329.1/:1-411(+)